MDIMNKNFWATQDTLQQILANQGGQPHGPHGTIPKGPVISKDPPIVNEIFEQLIPIVVAPQQQELLTLEQFIKNGMKAFKGTIEPNKPEAWTLNIHKTFRAMEVLENHWVRLDSLMLSKRPHSSRRQFRGPTSLKDSLTPSHGQIS